MIQVRRGADRFRTVAPGLTSWHSFSYGPHYDPANLGVGALIAHNEDRLEPGAGYDRHAHRGVDIVTWVLDGTLVHQHWLGAGPPTRERLRAGSVQVLRTGSGVEHAEHAAVDGPGAHYVQMWVTSDRPDDAARYERRDLGAGSDGPGGGSAEVTTVASDHDRSALALSRAKVELVVLRLPPGARTLVPVAATAHVFVARGAATVTVVHADTGIRLDAGDGLVSRAEAGLAFAAEGAAELLLWRLPA